MLIFMGLTCLAIYLSGYQAIQKTIKDSLIETVEENIDEIKYYDTLPDYSDSGSFLEFENGYLEIDDDFLDEVNGVYTALYTEDNSLVYGENPITSAASSLAFSNRVVQKLKVNGTVYYIFDRTLEDDGLEGMWLRGVVSSAQGTDGIMATAKVFVFILPLLFLLAVIGGWLIAGRTLKPLNNIALTARRITDGGDLKQRIDIGRGNDEIHMVANQFNDMFERLDNSFEAEKQFTSDASHELRTPMAVIMAQCELTLEEDRSSGEYKKALSVIERQGRKMNRLINDMLDYTRLEMRSERYPFAKTDFSAIVSDTCADLALISERRISLKWQAEKNIYVDGNAHLLTRALTNLVSNAYRYGKDGGHILVSLNTEDTFAVMRVADDGIGIAPEDQEKIFARFYQADSSRAGEGTGLGLSIAAQIAKLHKGEVSVNSRPGEGSIFTVRLPLYGQ